MHQIDRAVVRAGQLVLTGLPFADGQSVRVSVVELPVPPQGRRSIAEVRRILRGGVERFDNPTEPMIPPDHWEMTR